MGFIRPASSSTIYDLVDDAQPEDLEEWQMSQPPAPLDPQSDPRRWDLGNLRSCTLVDAQDSEPIPSQPHSWAIVTPFSYLDWLDE